MPRLSNPLLSPRIPLTYLLLLVHLETVLNTYVDENGKKHKWKP